MVYQKSLSALVEEVRQGNDKALFDAVRIDRTMVACPSIVHRISMAELTGDTKFFRHLKSAMKGPSRKHMVALDEMRYMMQALVETGADRLNAENLEQVFVKHLKLYPGTPGAQKNLYKHYTATKKTTTANDHLRWATIPTYAHKVPNRCGMIPFRQNTTVIYAIQTSTSNNRRWATFARN